MLSIDLRTIFLNYLATDIVCLIVMIFLWRQTYKRFEGTLLLVFDYLFQVLCLLFILLRGHIPDFVSIDVSNTLSVAGVVLGYIGLERFTGQRSRQLHNYLLIAVFFVVHTYFTFIQPNLEIRGLNSGVVYLIICFQSFWLLLYRVPKSFRKYTIYVGIAYAIYCLINIIRIVYFFVYDDQSTDYFHSGSFQVFVIISYQLLFVFLTFSLTLMINKRLFSEIESQEEKYSKAFHSVPYGIAISRFPDGELLQVNKGFEQLTGFSAESVLGNTTIKMNFWVDIEDRKSIIRFLGNNEKVSEKEFLFRKNSGEIRNGQISSEIFIVNNEKCIISVINDITERRNSEKIIEQQIQELYKLNATKDKLFSIIAHDLRSPVSGFVGLTDFLGKELTDLPITTVQELILSMGKSANNLFRLLENLLQWSQIQKGEITFRPGNLQLNLIADTSIELYQEKAKHKEIEIKNDIPDSLFVFADNNMLQAIFRNLVSNALKYTNKGGSVSIFAKKASETTVEVCIQDSGIGMNQSLLNNLFKLDVKTGRNGTDGEPSAGLGLLLCKEFVEKQGGAIWVESEENIGSTFCFSLPIEQK